MKNDILLTGNCVRVTSYGPFRGLRGTIQKVDIIADDPEDPFCFYLIVLEGSSLQAPIWFGWHEVECIGFPASAPHPQRQLASIEAVQI